jgi:hypothetical protein
LDHQFILAVAGMTVRVTPPMLAAFDHFMSIGFIENGAGAAVGNFCQESGEMLIATMFREHPDYSGGVPDALKSGGIAEWLGDRKTAYIAFANRAEVRLELAKGSLLNDLGTQCDFVVYELQTTPEYANLYQQLTSGTRSIVNLTANFMAVYERPKLGPTANLDNRIAHAEAVVARARELKAQPSPQPAPPVHIPSLPGSKVLPPILPAPAPSPGVPQISATSAGRRAAEQAYIAEMLNHLLAERAALEEEIADFQDMAAKLGKRNPTQELPKLTAIPPLVQPQRKTHMNVVTSNPWTSIAGFGSLISAGLGVYHAVSIGSVPDQTEVSLLFSSAISGIGLLFAKDWNRTGGTVSAVTGAVGTPVSLVDKQ